MILLTTHQLHWLNLKTSVSKYFLSLIYDNRDYQVFQHTIDSFKEFNIQHLLSFFIYYIGTILFQVHLYQHIHQLSLYFYSCFFLSSFPISRCMNEEIGYIYSPYILILLSIYHLCYHYTFHIGSRNWCLFFFIHDLYTPPLVHSLALFLQYFFSTKNIL